MKKQVRKINKKQFKKAITKIALGTIAVIYLGMGFINICKYPEKYMTTLKYQLQNDVKAGNKEAIEYYEKNYLSKNIRLWED